MKQVKIETIQELSEAVRQQIKAAGDRYTLQELADVLGEDGTGVHKSSVSRFIAGQNNLEVYNALRLLRFLMGPSVKLVLHLPLSHK